MQGKQIDMKRAREIFRQKWQLLRPHRFIAQSLGTSVGTVSHTLRRGKAAGLDWDAICDLSDVDLSRRLYGNRGSKPGGQARAEPDLGWIHAERKKPGVTLQLLHVEYITNHPDGYQYTAFCRRYTDWLSKKKLSMRQVHKSGDKLFVDYAGKRPRLIDIKTGEITYAELFVCTLGASNYTYVEATASQKSADFIGSHLRAFEFFGGVPNVLVPDQLKSAVTGSCRYEPQIQRTYEAMAEHYNTVVLPARPRKPKDKSKVEVAVLIAERWILARIRNEMFHTLAQLNERIIELLEDLNNRPMKTYGNRSRRTLFEDVDRPYLKPLPASRFVHAIFKKAKVNIDYHIEADGHYYSVPHALVKEVVEARISPYTVEILHQGKRVASHQRSQRKGRHTTVPEHMPKAHQRHLEWSPSRLMSWAKSLGPNIEALVVAILNERRHPEQGYRSCLGIMRLEKRYGKDRLDSACERAMGAGARSYKRVENILKNNLDKAPMPAANKNAVPKEPHENIRGADCYRQTQNNERTEQHHDD